MTNMTHDTLSQTLDRLKKAASSYGASSSDNEVARATNEIKKGFGDLLQEVETARALSGTRADAMKELVRTQVKLEAELEMALHQSFLAEDQQFAPGWESRDIEVLVQILWRYANPGFLPLSPSHPDWESYHEDARRILREFVAVPVQTPPVVRSKAAPRG